MNFKARIPPPPRSSSSKEVLFLGVSEVLDGLHGVEDVVVFPVV